MQMPKKTAAKQKKRTPIMSPSGTPERTKTGSLKGVGGAPPRFKTPAEMQKAIDAYFDECRGRPWLDADGNPMLDKQGKPIYIESKPVTVTGLCLALGFNSRDALLDYQGKSEFNDTVTRAKMRCQEYAESRLYDKDGANGAKFSLANNFGWREQPDGGSVNVLVLDAGERRERLAELLQLQGQQPAIDADYKVLSDCPEPIDRRDTDSEDD
jgi:hypothetical protein